MTVMSDNIPASDEIVRHSECKNFILTMAGRLGVPLEERVQSPSLHELDPHVTTWHWAVSFRWLVVGSPDEYLAANGCPKAVVTSLLLQLWSAKWDTRRRIKDFLRCHLH